jgi:hypothetical protein
MKINRTIFFICVAAIIAAPFLITKLVWLSGTRKTMGAMSFNGKSYTGQLGHDYAVIKFVVGSQTYFVNGPDNISYEKGTPVPVRYTSTNPNDARLATFIGLWGDTLVFAGVPCLIILLIALHPGIVPYRSSFLLKKQKPFITQQQ